MMNKWIVGLAAVIATAAVQADTFSGKVTAIKADEDGLGKNLVIDGRAYLLTPATSVSVRLPNGKSLWISASQLSEGLWVNYALSNQAGAIGDLDTVQISGPVADVQRIIQSAP
ncbi:MAG TPA: hypothetical protein VIM96_07610 [Pseudomonadales bacterium]